MCLADLIVTLKREGIDVNEYQIRYAIRSGKVSRPAFDGSLRFKFTKSNVAELVKHFGSNREPVEV